MNTKVHSVAAGYTAVGLLLVCGQLAQAQLIGHYPLDDITAGTTSDTTGMNGVGTVTNGTGNITTATGILGNAFSFTGPTSEFVSINDASFGKSAFSASSGFSRRLPPIIKVPWRIGLMPARPHAAF